MLKLSSTPFRILIEMLKKFELVLECCFKVESSRQLNRYHTLQIMKSASFPDLSMACSDEKNRPDKLESPECLQPPAPTNR